MRRTVKYVLLLLAVVLLFLEGLETFLYLRYKNIKELHGTRIEEKWERFLLHVKKSKKPDYPCRNIIFAAKEGPFWFSANETFSEVKIGCCRNLNMIVAYFYYEIPSPEEKRHILNLLKTRFGDRAPLDKRGAPPYREP